MLAVFLPGSTTKCIGKIQVTTTPPDKRYPGKIVLASFFNEDWGLMN